MVEVEKLLVEDGDSFVEASAPPKEVLEQEREPDIGPIVECIELDLDVVELHYTVKFLPGVAVEEGNLPWLEEETEVEVEEKKEALEEMLSRDQRLFEVVEVVKEREQLVVMVDIDAAEVKDSRSLPAWSEEVASLCGLKHMEVLEIIEKQMKEGLETDEGTVELAPFPWQLLPSQWEKGEKARKEKQEEKRAEEAAEMWKKQALMMSLPKEVNSSTPVTSIGRSSSYGSRTSTYFDKSVLQVCIAVGQPGSFVLIWVTHRQTVVMIVTKRSGPLEVLLTVVTSVGRASPQGLYALLEYIPLLILYTPGSTAHR